MYSGGDKFYRLPKTIFEFSRHYTTFIDSGTNFRHRQERSGTIVQKIHERDDQERDDNCACNSLHCFVLVFPLLCMPNFHSCFRCNTQISNIANFKRNSLKNCNDSEHAVKTKNAPFFMNFPNI